MNDQSLIDRDLYAEVGENYRYFLGWRYKIFAGYLTGLGALGYAFGQTPHEHLKTALVVAGIVLSFVFWVFDLRTRDLHTVSQHAGQRLEKRHSLDGPYSDLDRLRYLPRKTLGRLDAVLTHGGALEILTSVVIGCLCGSLLWRTPYWSAVGRFLLAGGTGIAITSLIWFAMFRISRLARDEIRVLRDRLDDPGPKTPAGADPSS